MSARDDLLTRIVDDVAAGGLADRSLRDVARSVGTSHRMLIYHFGSRAGLVKAIVERVEAAQRDLLDDLADDAVTGAQLVGELWRRVSAPEMRPFVRLFFECVALAEGADLTDPWLGHAARVAAQLGIDADETDLRLGVAVTRGLLVDVLGSGDAGPATAALDRFAARWPIG